MAPRHHVQRHARVQGVKLLCELNEKPQGKIKQKEQIHDAPVLEPVLFLFKDSPEYYEYDNPNSDLV